MIAEEKYQKRLLKSKKKLKHTMQLSKEKKRINWQMIVIDISILISYMSAKKREKN